jgi:hypothetical protein
LATENQLQKPAPKIPLIVPQNRVLTQWGNVIAGPREDLEAG